jgi:methionyl-tRNA formyltransferase
MAIKLVYMGTPDYAKTILEGIIKDDKFQVSLVITQPDKPVGRKKIMTSSPVKKLAVENGLKLLQPKTLKNSDIRDEIAEENPDFIVVAAYGKILPKEILDIAPCINLHASILPKYRGASPIQEAILNGDKFTGVTAMMMEESLDSGDILSISFLKLKKDIRVDEVTEQLSKLAKDLTLSTLKNFSNLKPLPQHHFIATYCRKIKKDDGEISFNLTAEEIYRKFRAFYKWPEIYFSNGLKLLDIEISSLDHNKKAGEILGIEKESVIVATKKGSIKINTLKPKGKKAMSAKAYLLGKRLRVGDSIF